MQMSITEKTNKEEKKKVRKKKLNPSILELALKNANKNMVLYETLKMFEKSTDAYDYMCKLIMSNKQILANIMKYAMKECKDMTIEEIIQSIENDPRIDVTINDHDQIVGMNVEDGSIIHATIRYDILFKATLPTKKGKKESVGIFINFEIQKDETPGYPLVSRGIYYASRLLARQKNAEDGFEASDFKDLQKVYSIWICPDHTKEKDDVINVYHITEDCLKNEWHNQLEDYDLMEVIMLYPGNDYDYEDEGHGILEMLNILFTRKLKAEEKKQLLEKKYAIIMTEKMDKEVEFMCNLSESVLKEGMEQGLKQGVEQGEIKSAIQLTKNLMESANVDMNKAMDMLKLSQEIRQIVIEELSKE